MADIATVWTGQGGDWVLSNATLLATDDLTTAVLISLFTDATASPGDVIPDARPGGPADPRGWWGDAYATKPIGSKLWLLSRAKQTARTLADAKDHVATALQWLLDDGVVAALDIATAWIAPGQLGIVVEIFKTDGSKTSVDFAWAWAGQGY